MTTIDKISLVLSDHAKNAIDEGEALRRVLEIAGASDRLSQMLRILVEHARTEIESQRNVVRRLVESIARDAQGMVVDMNERGPDPVSTTWIAMHVNGLVDAKAKLEAARERLRELEQLLEA